MTEFQHNKVVVFILSQIKKNQKENCGRLNICQILWLLYQQNFHLSPIQLYNSAVPVYFHKRKGEEKNSVKIKLEGH